MIRTRQLRYNLGLKPQEQECRAEQATAELDRSQPEPDDEGYQLAPDAPIVPEAPGLPSDDHVQTVVETEDNEQLVTESITSNEPGYAEPGAPDAAKDPAPKTAQAPRQSRKKAKTDNTT